MEHVHIMHLAINRKFKKVQDRGLAYAPANECSSILGDKDAVQITLWKLIRLKTWILNVAYEITGK